MVFHSLRRLVLALVCTALSGFGARAHAAFGFVAGHDYSSDFSSRTITEYTAAGTTVGTLTLSSTVADGLRGIAFSSTGLLYTAAVVGSGYNVLALNSAGVIQRTYTAPTVYAAGNLAFGKIALDSQYIYVGAQDVLTRFTIGGSATGTTIYTDNQIFDVKVLPSGNLLVASAYNIKEITTGGTIIRTFSPQGISLVDIRGMEYNAATNDLFVTMLGYTGQYFQLMRFDATSGALEKQVTFNYGMDLFLTTGGSLLVGTYTQKPGFFSQDLVQTGTFGTAPQMFVTQYTAPEPGSVSLLAGIAAVFSLRRQRAGRG